MALCDFVWEFESDRKNYLLERRTRARRIALLQCLHTGLGQCARVDGGGLHIGQFNKDLYFVGERLTRSRDILDTAKVQ